MKSLAPRSVLESAGGVDPARQPVEGRPAPAGTSWLPPLTAGRSGAQIGGMAGPKISVFLADDNLIVREVTAGGSWLDPRIVEALVRPASQGTDLTSDEEEILQMLAEGRPIKAIAVARRTTPTDVDDAIQKLFLKLAQAASAGAAGALRRLKLLHQAIVDREEQGESLSRLLPTGLAEKVRPEGRRIGEAEKPMVNVLVSDI